MDNTPLTIEEIHEGTLIILKKIIEICDKINVNYFIAYGTLIGAVRHQGFIPWDDDLDIIMLRPEYDKFVAYCDAHEKELYPFRLMNRFNTPGYPFNISRFNDLRYRMETNGYPDAGMGMFVDIYPFDGCGKKGDNMWKTNLKKKIYSTLLSLSYNGRFCKSKKGILKTIIKYPIYKIARLLGMDYILNKLERLRLQYSYEESEMIGLITWDYYVIPIEKQLFLKYMFINFEGINVKAPLNYDYILRKEYGNYMELPPIDKRVPHHEYVLYRK